jgi:hypothetical protein
MLRWVFRVLCVTLLMLCVAIWVASYFRTLGLSHNGAHHDTYFCFQGASFIFLDDNTPLPDRNPKFPPGWYLDISPHESFSFNGLFGARTFHFLGFAYKPRALANSELWIVVPLWFSTVFSCGLLWIVWTKTRSKINGRGFPVEVVAAQRPVRGNTS